MPRQQTQTARLDRIENKIDKLSDAMVAFARAEEKLVTIEKNNHTVNDRINQLSKRLADVEKKAEENARTVNVINKIFWIFMVAVVGAFVSATFFI